MKRTKKLKTLLAACCLLVLPAMASVAGADWQPDPNDKWQTRSHKAVQKFREEAPKTERYFEDAYGYAVLPRVGRIGAGFGGSYGKGLVFEGDDLVGKTGFWQFTSGIQGGFKSFSMIVFFKDQNALDYFKARKWQLLGQAGVTLGPVGLDGTPAYNDGVAIFVLTRFGLMGEFTISGAKFTYKDLPTN